MYLIPISFVFATNLRSPPAPLKKQGGFIVVREIWGGGGGGGDGGDGGEIYTRYRRLRNFL